MYFKTIEPLQYSWYGISNQNENLNDMDVIPNSMDVVVNVNWTFEDVSPHIFITWNSVNATLKLRACIQTWKIYSCIFDLVHYFLTSITKEFGRNFIIVTLSNVQIAPAKHRFEIKLSHPIFLMLYSILMYFCAIIFWPYRRITTCLIQAPIYS